MRRIAPHRALDLSKRLLVVFALAGAAHGQVYLTPPVYQAPPVLPPPSAVITVDQSGGGNFVTIKQAVQHALLNGFDGAYIRVRAGTYPESGINFGYYNLVLESVDGLGMAIIDGTPPVGGPSESIITLEHFQTGASVINGFEFRNGRDGSGGAIKCMKTSPTIINNTFSNNSAAFGGAIHVERGSPLIAGNLFAHNGYGAAHGSTGPDAVEGGAINLLYSSSLILSNYFSANNAGGAGGAVFTAYESKLLLTNNIFDDNTVDGTGIALGNGGALAAIKLSYVIANNNNFTNNSAWINGGAVWLSGPSETPSLFNENLFRGNLVDVDGQDGGALYADNSTGSYTKNIFELNQCSRFGGAICCYSAGISTFTGNTIRNNAAQLSGGGIACLFDADAQILGNEIRYNDVRDYYGTGAGIYVKSSSVTIRLNTIELNGRMSSGLPSVSMCQRGGGIDYLGGIFPTSSGRIVGNKIAHNQVMGFSGAGAGVALKNLNSASRFDSNVVQRNSATYGGCQGAGVLVEHDSSGPTPASFSFVNNTIVYNTNGSTGPGGPGFGPGGGVLFSGITAPFNIYNSIILNNFSSGDPNVASPSVGGIPLAVLDFCDVGVVSPPLVPGWSLPPGGATFMLYGVDPLFVDPTRNFHLQAVPAQQLRDVGNNSVVPSGAIDFDGLPRINGAAVDIGADEI
jgi:predicted outer membrane repeat protein